MGRRRRRIIKIVKKTLPKVFMCPQCGTISIKVNIKNNIIAKIVCGSCELNYEYKLNKKMQIIDIYNDFIDKFVKGRLKT